MATKRGKVRVFKRILVREVKAAYRKTKWRPVRGTYRVGIGVGMARKGVGETGCKQVGGCGIGVVAMARTFSTSRPGRANQWTQEKLARYMKLPLPYVTGFQCGFDAQDCPVAERDRDPWAVESWLGYADGMAAGKAVRPVWL